GSVLRQPQLAATLMAMAQHGADGFYRGRVADEMVQSVKRAGGIWEHADLSHYRVIEREPARFTYRDAMITTAPLPSSGALTLAQGLNILENFPLAQLSGSNRIHLIAEALRRAYQDRAEYLGDSDFVAVPTEKLMSKDYGRERAATIDLQRATPDVRLDAGLSARPSGTETTHFSIMDRAGNRVAATLSINTNFGSGFVAGNTGVLLNNEMDDFSIAPAVPNVYGLHGNQANAIMPGKRPLSSISPTFVEDAKGILIVGTPGGSRIISMVLLAIVNYVDDRQTDPGEIVGNPRFHQQHLPDWIEIEPDSFREEWVSGLKLKGHQVTVAAQKWGNMQLILFDKATQRSITASDPRGAAALPQHLLP
ncbi:MAG: gamma-glutamyltransferase, partial [Nitrosospira sp.]|nr:gamma-glutamyltransferase [Nitrosospira sp.]